MGQKVLVTGADGFIGSHLVEALVRAGHDVRAFVLYNSLRSHGWLDRVPEEVASAVEIMAGDVRDAYRVRQAVDGRDVVYHLAALIAIPYSYVAPASYVQTNVSGTLHVLEAAREHSVERVVHTSTSEVYGTARQIPISEDHPLQGQSPYSASKIGADQMALSFHAAFGTPVAIIRPFNTYGPRQSDRAVIPTIIGQIAAGHRRIRLGALHPTRDFTFVDDTVAGFMAVAAADAAVGEVINVGTGHEISIGELATLIAEVMNVEVEVELDERRLRPEKSEVDRLLASAEKARRLAGWEPRFSGRDGLRQGLGVTAEWFTDDANRRYYHPEEYVV